MRVKSLASDDQPMDSETSLGGSGEEQQTVAMAQSRFVFGAESTMKKGIHTQGCYFM